ncbi:MAG: hypothetical protein ABI626_07590 [Sphingomicrobium sp.]
MHIPMHIELARRSLLALAAGAVAACATTRVAPRALTLDEVIRRNTRARGGAAALDRVRALQVDVEIVEGGRTLNGRYTANVAGMVRIDIYAGGANVYAEGVDGTGVWRWTGGSDPAQPSTATGAANALTNGAENHLFGWHRFAERGHALALMPSQLIDGVTYPVVEARYSTGHVSYFYVDPVSWLAVRRRDERAYHPDNDTTKQSVETRFSDFVAVDGVLAAHLNTDYDLGTDKVLSTNHTLARRINPPLAADYFDRDRRASPSW